MAIPRVLSKSLVKYLSDYVLINSVNHLMIAPTYVVKDSNPQQQLCHRPPLHHCHANAAATRTHVRKPLHHFHATHLW